MSLISWLGVDGADSVPICSPGSDHVSSHSFQESERLPRIKSIIAIREWGKRSDLNNDGYCVALKSVLMGPAPRCTVGDVHQLSVVL